MYDIKSIRKISDGKWLVSLAVTAECGCYKRRKNYLFLQTEKPTSNEIENRFKGV